MKYFCNFYDTIAKKGKEIVMTKELEILKDYCIKKGLRTDIVKNNDKSYLVDSENKYCFVDSLGDNFYKILATELSIDEEGNAIQQTIESKKLYIDDAYSFIEGVINDNEEIRNRA